MGNESIRSNDQLYYTKSNFCVVDVFYEDINLPKARIGISIIFNSNEITFKKFADLIEQNVENFMRQGFNFSLQNITTDHINESIVIATPNIGNTAVASFTEQIIDV